MNRQLSPGGAIDAVAALDAVAQAVIITDPDGIVRFWNQAAESLYGWPASDVVGRPVTEVTPADPLLGDAATIFEKLREGTPWSGDMLLRRRDGSTFIGSVTDTPMLDGSGRVTGVIGVSEDVSERRRSDALLQRSEQRLRLALQAGGLGVWQWDLATGTVEWDAALEGLFGLAPGTFSGSFDDYRAMLHPDDRQLMLDVVAAAVADGTDYTVEHRIVRADGAVRWLQGSGQPVWEGDEVLGLIGVTRDITEARQAADERDRALAEEAAARADADAARARLELLSRATATMGATLDLEERLAHLTGLLVPRFADASLVYVLDADGRPEIVTLCHRDAGQEQALRDLLEHRPARIDERGGVGAAIRAGRSLRLPDIGDEILTGLVDDDEQLQILRALRLTAGVFVPLIGQSGPFGAVVFLTVEGRRMGGDDERLAEDLCSRVAVHIENGRLLEAREFDRSANRYQAALLNTVFEASVDGMLAVDAAGGVLAYNRRFLDLWGFDDRLVDGGDAALLEAAADQVADRRSFLTSVRAAYAERHRGLHDEIVLADGRILDRHGTCLDTPDGEYLGFAWSFRDVTAERAQQAEIAAAGERFATLARTLQHSLLPPRMPRPAGIDLAACYHPALAGVEVGGDFYDVFAVGDDWMLVIGDVCGKGADAATLTALARYTLRAAAIHDADPSSILLELNAAMIATPDLDDGFARFVTVCCIRLRPAGAGVVADIACGGHPPPVILRADGSTEPGGTPGTLIGVFDEVDVTTVSTVLAPGDGLVAVTDGVLEARDDDGVELQQQGLTEIVASVAHLSASGISEAVEARSLEIQGGVARDDIAILVARILGPGGGP